VTATIAELPRSVRYITSVARRGQSRIEIVPTDDFSSKLDDIYGQPGWSDCPFASATIHYKTRRVLISDDAPVAALIHELGHVLASPYPPDDERCTEPPFLGWEARLAMEAGCFQEWLDGMQDYGIEFEGSYVDIGDLTPDEQLRMIGNVLCRAARGGLIDAAGHVTPHYRRRRKAS
jgi:hypothetical protein